MGALYDACLEVKSWITDQQVKEESITDWMLRYISKHKKTTKTKFCLLGIKCVCVSVSEE